MKIRVLLVGLLAFVGFVACAPADRPTVRPLLIKISESAKIGDTVTIQGRYLGSAATAFAVFGANDAGQGGTRVAGDNVVAWSGSEVQVKVPAGTKSGGNFVFISVGGVLSNGLPFSVSQ
ncbi:MAG: cell surface protein [Pleurocapsa sp. SU_196_0]|nr:cell surface protein [Pleurocapsa sp. SU_196_0]